MGLGCPPSHLCESRPSLHRNSTLLMCTAKILTFCLCTQFTGWQYCILHLRARSTATQPTMHTQEPSLRQLVHADEHLCYDSYRILPSPSPASASRQLMPAQAGPQAQPLDTSTASVLLFPTNSLSPLPLTSGTGSHRLDLSLVLNRQLVDQGSDHAAWAAPGRPEVHDDRHIALQHQLLEVVICHGASCRTGRQACQ